MRCAQIASSSFSVFSVALNLPTMKIRRLWGPRRRAAGNAPAFSAMAVRARPLANSVLEDLRCHQPEQALPQDPLC